MSAQTTLGKLVIELKRGGSLAGTLNFDYLNEPLLQSLSKFDKNRNRRKFKITFTVEEQVGESRLRGIRRDFN